ncbi:MAG: thioredoxin family protein [Gammaproteobacteria bacterium]|nr:thioredoxin family protein [Gammaproteobacteria bacterium]
MKKFVLVALAASVFQLAQAGDIGYDHKADPFQQLNLATRQAQDEKKLVLVISGGDWCKWCHILSDYLKKDAALMARLKEVFVISKIYIGPKNPNQQFFSQLPQLPGVPGFWVLSATGEVLAAKNTGELESGDSYSRKLFLEFIGKWEKHLNRG